MRHRVCERLPDGAILYHVTLAERFPTRIRAALLSALSQRRSITLKSDHRNRRFRRPDSVLADIGGADVMVCQSVFRESKARAA
jgi:hypothetical protein